MVRVRNTWTEEKLHTEALKYQTRVEFAKESRAAYSAANARGILDKICSHMESQLTFWTEESIAKEANKYSTRLEFSNNSRSAYESARSCGILDEIFE